MLPQHTDFTARTEPPTGFPFPYVDTNRNTEIVLSVGGGPKSVWSTYFMRSTGELGSENLSHTAWAPSSNGQPVGYYNSAADIHHIIYADIDGHLHELFWHGFERVAYGGDLTATASAPIAHAYKGPSGFVNAHSDNIVIFTGTDGHIRSLYWKEGPNPVGHDDLSGVASTPVAAGDVFAYYTVHNDTHQVVYRAYNGHVYELFWRGVEPVRGWDLTERSRAPISAASSNLSAYYHAGYKHVIYAADGGHLHDIMWAPGTEPIQVDLTEAFRLPHSGAGPVAFTVERTNTQHVVFLHAHEPGHNRIYELIR